MAVYSFLIGAGFSIPSGIPSTKDINDKFSSIKAESFMQHSNLSAFFLPQDTKKDETVGRRSTLEETLLEEFTSFYIAIKDTYHYEDFFDYYHLQYRTDNYNKETVAFLDDYRERTGYNKDNLNALGDIDRVFQQLIANYLIKWNDPVHMARGYRPSIAQFLNLIDNIKDNNILNFHTLNHDLLFESFNSSDTFQGKLIDGFEDIASPYYGKLQDRYLVRLPRFVNNYEKGNYRLYKLHGSLDMYEYFDDEETEIIKSDKGIGKSTFIKEVDRNGERTYHKYPWNLSPLFLTGTKEKINFYSRSPYKEVIGHFTQNLSKSDALIVIGYGFGDSEINQIIREQFLPLEKPTIAINPSVPQQEFFTELQNLVLFHHLESSVENFPIQDILEVIL